MIITGITTVEFEQAIAKAGALYGDNLRAEIGREYSKTRFAGRVVLRHTAFQLYGRGDDLAPGQRRSWQGRRINATCWHAYRDVLIEVFNINPNAKVRTSMAKYLGKDSFYEEFPKTAWQNIGSHVQPITMPQCCNC